MLENIESYGPRSLNQPKSNQNNQDIKSDKQSELKRMGFLWTKSYQNNKHQNNFDDINHKYARDNQWYREKNTHRANKHNKIGFQQDLNTNVITQQKQAMDISRKYDKNRRTNTLNNSNHFKDPNLRRIRRRQNSNSRRE